MERQLGKATKVLSDCCKRKFEPRAGRSTQSQAAEPQDPLEVRKQHLNLLAISSGLIVGRRLGDRAGDIARCIASSPRGPRAPLERGRILPLGQIY